MLCQQIDYVCCVSAFCGLFTVFGISVVAGGSGVAVRLYPHPEAFFEFQLLSQDCFQTQ